MAENFRIGCWATDDPSKIIHLWGHVNSSVQYSSFWRAGNTTITTGTAYRVASGKSFYAASMQIAEYYNGANMAIALGHADNAVIYNGSSPTGTITHVMGHASSPSNTNPGWQCYHHASYRRETDINELVGPFAALSYPFFNYAGTGGVGFTFHMWGFEN